VPHYTQAAYDSYCVFGPCVHLSFVYIHIYATLDNIKEFYEGYWLARPGRKQATATRLGNYLNYYQRSSIYFLTCCSNFCKPLKIIQKFVRPTRCPRQQWPPRLTKNGELSIVFSVRGTVSSPTERDPESSGCDQENGSPGRLVSSALQVQGESRHFRERTRQTWWTSRGVFP